MAADILRSIRRLIANYAIEEGRRRSMMNRFKFFRYFFLCIAYRFVYTFLVVIFLNGYYGYSTNLSILINYVWRGAKYYALRLLATNRTNKFHIRNRHIKSIRDMCIISIGKSRNVEKSKCGG